MNLRDRQPFGNQLHAVFCRARRGDGLVRPSFPVVEGCTEPPIATVHVVRRYGPVGGMERYVWELTRSLTDAGHPVTVLCERCHADRPADVAVHELGEIAPRPRWLSLLRFSGRGGALAA